MLLVRDDGKGFDATSVSTGFGLNIMQERANAVGAGLTMTSRPGEGTEVLLIWNVTMHTPDE